MGNGGIPTQKSLADANTLETFQKREKLLAINNAKKSGLTLFFFYKQCVQW